MPLHRGLQFDPHLLAGAVSRLGGENLRVYLAVLLGNFQVGIPCFALRFGQIQPFFVISGAGAASAHQRYADKHIGQIFLFDGHLYVIGPRRHGGGPCVQHALALYADQGLCGFIRAFDQNARGIAGSVFLFILFQEQNIVIILLPRGLAFAQSHKGKPALHRAALRVFGRKQHLVRARLRRGKTKLRALFPHA